MATYMVIERYRDGRAAEIYERFRTRGRLLPPGVAYVNSWVHPSLTFCFQVMTAEHRDDLDTWMRAWSDLVDFEVHEVLSSEEASRRSQQ